MSDGGNGQDSGQASRERVRHFIAGTLAGATGVFVGHPFDTVKVRLQTLPGAFKGPLQCFVQTLRREGVRGLYKGLSSPITGDSLTNCLVFGVYGLTRRAQLETDQTEEHFPLLSLTQIGLAGGAAGLIGGLIQSPVELIKIKLQVQTGAGAARLYSGPIDCIKKIVRADGLKGLTRGLGATWWRDIPGFGAYFVVYEGLRRKWADDPLRPDDVSPVRQLVAGGLGGIAAWGISYPIDVIKSRLQTNPEYKGMWDCAVKSYRAEGHRVFFTGLGTTVVRSFPVNAVIFLVYEVLIKTIPA